MAIGTMSATKPCDAGEPIGHSGTRTHRAARPWATSSGCSGDMKRSIRSHERVLGRPVERQLERRARLGRRHGRHLAPPVQLTGRAVGVRRRRVQHGAPADGAEHVGLAGGPALDDDLDVDSTTTSPGEALATYWVVIHTSGRPVAASAATAQAASPLPP